MASSDLQQYLAARPVIRAVAIALACLTIVVGIAVGISITNNEAAATRATAETDLERYAYAWQTRIGTRLSEASSLAASAASFAAGGATHASNHSLSVAERVQFINNDTWPIMAASLFRQVPGMLSLQLQGSGIIAQMWPPGSAPQSLDTWNLPPLRAGWLSLVAGAVPTVAGPVTLVQGGIGILARYPLYLADPPSLETFWGAGVAVFRVSEMLAAMNVSQGYERDGYDVICYAADLTNASAPPAVVMSTPGAQGLAAAGNVRPAGSFTVRIETADPTNGLFMTTLPASGLPSGSVSTSGVLSVVVPTLLVAVLVAALVFVVALVSFKVKHRHVPATSGEEVTAMALVSVQRLGWWTEHQLPEQLAADLLAFEQEVGRVASAHGCHLSGRISDGCCLVVGADVAPFAKAADKALHAVFADLKIVRHSAGACSFVRPKSNGSTARRSRMNGGKAPSTAHGSANNRSGKYEDSGEDHSTSARSNSLARGASSRGFEFAICLHAGALRNTYDPDADRYSFFGAGVAVAAIGVDATRAGEVSATAAFGEAIGAAIPSHAATRELDDDDGSMLYILHDAAGTAAASAQSHGGNTPNAAAKHHPSGHRESVVSMTDSSLATASHGGGGVASALSAKTGVAVRRRVGLLVLELLPAAEWRPTDRAPPVPNFPEVLEVVASAAARHNGAVASVVGGRVVIAFNALKPVTSPSRSAAVVDAEIREALHDRRIVSAVGLGFVHVAVAAGSVLVCMGDPVRRTAALLDEAVADNSKASGLEAAAVTDAGTAMELRQAFELQCIGKSVVEGTGLRYVLERAWPDDDEGPGDEWLYELQRLEEQSPFTGANAALEAGENPSASPDLKAAEAALAAPDNFHPLAIAALQALVGSHAKSLTPPAATPPEMVHEQQPALLPPPSVS